MLLAAAVVCGGGGRYAGSMRVGFHNRTVLSFAPVMQYLPSAVVMFESNKAQEHVC